MASRNALAGQDGRAEPDEAQRSAAAGRAEQADSGEGRAEPGTGPGSAAHTQVAGARDDTAAMIRAVPAEPATGPGGRASDQVYGPMAYLTELAAALDARGLVARVARARSGVAFVRVVNPLAATMREQVTCAPSPAGLNDWYYWWSWGECMHRVGDPAGAAAKVARVLTTAGAPIL
jgi:hypothetical protein